MQVRRMSPQGTLGGHSGLWVGGGIDGLHLYRLIRYLRHCSHVIPRFLLSVFCYPCRPFGSLGDEDLQAASLALASIDNVLLLGQDDINDVSLKAGLGWRAGLRSKRWRWSYVADLESELGFPKGSTALLGEWNQLDRLLYVWGSGMSRLDAAFHSAVALAKDEVDCDREASRDASKVGSLGSIDEALAAIGLQVSLYGANLIDKLVISWLTSLAEMSAP